MKKTTLIVICGAPASGKTTLARRLSTDLGLPLLERDTIKESLAGTIEVTDREASKRVGRASFQVLYDLTFEMLECGVTVMIEANLTRRFASTKLERLETASRVTLVQCVADRAAIEQRYRNRHSGGERHAAHFDLDALPDLIAGLDAGDYDVASLGYPTITVSTDNGYRPAYGEIVARLT